MKTIIVDSGLNSYFTLLMALRVLLADESSTIKRVMQLALQDFGVEVKAVPVGLDVVPVTKTFRPDVVFADILLTKHNGYEVCADLKADPETKNIPVVLMWSGFMDLDEGKSAQCQANARLEKPFDAETLRQLVTRLVPKTQTNPVSSYLQFPTMPEFTEERLKEPAANMSYEHITPSAEEDSSIIEIPEEDSLSGFSQKVPFSKGVDLPMVASPDVDPDKDLLVAPDEEFASVPLKSSQQRDQHEDDGWTQQDLKKFKIQIPDEVPEEVFSSKFLIPKEPLNTAGIESDGEFEEIQFNENLEATQIFTRGTKAPQPAETPPPRRQEATPAVEKSHPQRPAEANAQARPVANVKSDPQTEMMERVIRQEAREVIESICWKVLPDIAERIIREEIEKLLREIEK